MSNDAIDTTLYFESTASGHNIDARASSGQTNQFEPFTGSSSNINHATADLTLPAVTTPGNNLAGSDSGIVAEGHLVLSGAVTLAGFCGATVQITLSPVTGTAHGTNTITGRAHLALPAVQVTGHALTGELASTPLDYPLTLPAVTVYARTGARFSGVLPRVQVTAHGLLNHTAIGAMRLPAVEISATAHRVQEAAYAHLILPAVTGLSGQAFGALVLPGVRVRALAVSGTQAVRRTWAMNIENHAVTEFDNFEFKQIARAFNNYWGAGMTSGLWQLGGDLDATSPIGWSFETGLSDLGSRGLKGVLCMYLDGIYEKKLEFTLVTDRARYTYTHAAYGDPEDHETQRISIGRGIRSVNIGLGLASPSGAYFECDSMTPEYVISNRNLGR